MKIQRRSFLSPLVIAIICVVSFGVYLPQLGLYLDDWPVFVAARLYGINHLWDYYFIDTRPVSSWTYRLLLNIFGYQPLPWQIYTLSIRCLTALAFWAVIRQVWPKNARLAFFAALLFAVSPIFKQQSTAVTFHQGWTQYLLVFISFWFMLRQVRAKSWVGRAVCVALALVAILLSDSISEYFVGVELARPVLLWIVIGPQKDWKARLRLTVLNWLPYLLITGLFVFWRLFIMEVPEFDRNKPQLLMNLFRHPRYALVTFSRLAFQDLAYVLLLSWVGAARSLVEGLRQAPAADPVWIALGVGGLLLGYVLWSERWPQDERTAHDRRNEALLAMAVGVLVVLVAGLPGWAIGRQAAATTGAYDDRFAFVGMFGAGLFLAGLLDLLPGKRTWPALLLALFVLLSVRTNLANSKSYVDSWASQRRFYWQLAWRAPDIEPQTVLYSDHEFARYMGSWATASAFNLLYPKAHHPQYVMYWYLNIYKMQDQLPEFINGTELYFRHNTLVIDTSSTQVIGFTMPPGPNACLWIISPRDQDNPLLPPILRDTARSSRLDLIRPTPKDPQRYPPADVFGPEPARDWCYTFEKADLARQVRQWNEIPRLWEAAQAQGQRPVMGLELIPFIEGYAQVSQWETALQLSEQARQLTPDSAPYLCKIWGHLERETMPSEARAAALGRLRARLMCR